MFSQNSWSGNCFFVRNEDTPYMKSVKACLCSNWRMVMPRNEINKSFWSFDTNWANSPNPRLTRNSDAHHEEVTVRMKVKNIPKAMVNLRTLKASNWAKFWNFVTVTPIFQCHFCERKLDMGQDRFLRAPPSNDASLFDRIVSNEL